MLNHRTNVLLDEKRHRVLSILGRKEKKSLGELIREAIDEKYGYEINEEEIIKKRKQAFEEILRLRKKIKPLPKGFDYKSLINWGRRF